MKTPSLHRQVLAATPRGFASPLSHGDAFEEPMSLSSGLANLPGTGSPGTFGSVRGKLRKARSQSILTGQRWFNPSGQAKAARTDRLLAGTMARLLAR